MIYTFLTDTDLKTAIRSDLLSQFAEDETKLTKYLKKTEKIAISQIKSKIRDRYDTNLIFPFIRNFNFGTQYNFDDIVYYEGNFYVAQNANIEKIPGVDDDWELHDVRNPLVVSYCVDITLFHLHKRINPRKIPELRKEAYKEALEWFEMLKIGNESPDLPFLEDGEEYIPWGSNPQIEHIY